MKKITEISVATTKAYSAQLAAMYCLAVQFARVREKITEEQYSFYISELLSIPEKMEKVLEDKERIQWFAAKYANAHDVFFVGRGIDYAISLEGSLKLKEISYIHSEAYAAGELKHGTISLIEQGMLVIGVLTQDELYEKTISNMLECKSRGAYLMGLTTYGHYEVEDQVNFAVYVPKVDEHFVGSLAVNAAPATETEERPMSEAKNAVAAVNAAPAFVVIIKIMFEKSICLPLESVRRSDILFIYKDFF